MKVKKISCYNQKLLQGNKYTCKKRKTLTGYPHIDKPWMKYYDKELAKQKLPEETIYRFMKNGIKDNMDNTIITYNGKKENGYEFLENIDKAAGILKGIGIEKDDRVMYLMPNIPETAYTMYAGSKIGAVSDYVDPRPDSINPKISADKLLRIITNEKPKSIFVFESCYLPMIKPIEEELLKLGLENVVIVSSSSLMTKKQQLNYIKESIEINGLKNTLKKLKFMNNLTSKTEKAIDESKLNILHYSDLLDKYGMLKTEEIEYRKNTLAAITHSSGTTSSFPKTIPLKNEGINSYAFQLMRSNVNTGKGDSTLHILPYFSAYGLGISHMGFSNADNMIEIPEFSPNGMGKLIKKYKPSILMGTPNWYLALPSDKALEGSDLSFIKIIGYGGDSMNKYDEIMINDYLKNHNCKTKISKGHGMSETSGGASYAIGDYNIPGSMGIPMIDTIYGVVDPETKEPLKFTNESDTISGELIISSPAIVDAKIDGRDVIKHGIYNNMDFIYTKDIGMMNKDGVLSFLSRDDRGFTRFDGFKVKPYQIEKQIKNVDCVKDCIISSYDDEEKFGKMIKADIILKDEFKSKDSTDIVNKILNDAFINNSNVSTRQIPTKIRFRDSFPMTINNKVDYRKIDAEELTGDETTIVINETNVSVSGIEIIEPSKKKILKKI